MRRLLRVGLLPVRRRLGLVGWLLPVRRHVVLRLGRVRPVRRGMHLLRHRSHSHHRRHLPRGARAAHGARAALSPHGRVLHVQRLLRRVVGREQRVLAVDEVDRALRGVDVVVRHEPAALVPAVVLP
eukprot:16290-Pelagococcus_subviridis.AAC.7